MRSGRETASAQPARRSAEVIHARDPGMRRVCHAICRNKSAAVSVGAARDDLWLPADADARRFAAEGAEVVGSLDEALSEPGAWVIGGGQIYTLALPYATRCEVTEVDVDLARDDDDALAPVLDEAWRGETGEWLTSRTGLRYRFHRYCRG